MAKEIKVKIYDDIYGQNFKLMVCSRKKILNQIKRDCPDIDDLDDLCENDGTSLTIISLKGERRHYIWLERFDWSIVSQGLLAHEILHFVFETMRHVGIKYQSEDYKINEEAFTYYFQYIFQKVYEELKPLR